MRTQEQVNEIVRRLLAEYPEAVCALDYDKDYELLFSVRLSAQCTDARVNMVTPALFARFPTLEAFAEADVEEVKNIFTPADFITPRRGTSSTVPLCCWKSTEERSPTAWRSFSAYPVSAEKRLTCCSAICIGFRAR
jgi:hypothetical protein